MPRTLAGISSGLVSPTCIQTLSLFCLFIFCFRETPSTTFFQTWLVGYQILTVVLKKNLSGTSWGIKCFLTWGFFGVIFSTIWSTTRTNRKLTFLTLDFHFIFTSQVLVVFHPERSSVREPCGETVSQIQSNEVSYLIAAFWLVINAETTSPEFSMTE